MRKELYCAVLAAGISLSCLSFAGEKGGEDGHGGSVGMLSTSAESSKQQASAQTAGEQPPQNGRKEGTEVIVARVNGIPVTLKSVVGIMDLYGAKKGHEAAGLAEREEAKKKALDRLILEELAYQKVRSEGLGLKIETTEVDKKVEDFRMKMGGAEAFEKALDKEGLTVAELRAIFERGIILERIFQREVFARISITDDEVQKEYEKEKDKFLWAEKLVIIDTVFFLDPDSGDSLDKVGIILNKILEDKGRDPWNLVPDGTFIIQEIELKKEKHQELYLASKKLKVGELSGAIKASDNLHIIKVKEYTPEKQFPLDKVRGLIEKKLRTEARQKRLLEWGEELRIGAKIEILVEGENRQLPGNIEK